MNGNRVTQTYNDIWTPFIRSPINSYNTVRSTIPINNPNPNNNTTAYLESLLNIVQPQPIGTNNFLEPVPIRATQEQINRATRTVRYGSFSTTQTRCPIDLSPFEDQEEVLQIRHCGHIFRRNNILSWFSTSPRCPMCRYDIRSDTSIQTPPSTHATSPVAEEYSDLTDSDNDVTDELDTSGNQEPQTSESQPPPQTQQTHQVYTQHQDFTFENTSQGVPSSVQIETSILPINTSISQDQLETVQNSLSSIVSRFLENNLQETNSNRQRENINSETHDVNREYETFTSQNNGDENQEDSN